MTPPSSTPCREGNDIVEQEREAIVGARLMVSGRYRIQWTFAGDSAGSLIRKGLIDQGGYLTDAGLRARGATA